jgi:hypothetical protein
MTTETYKPLKSDIGALVEVPAPICEREMPTPVSETEESTPIYQKILILLSVLLSFYSFWANTNSKFLPSEEISTFCDNDNAMLKR